MNWIERLAFVGIVLAAGAVIFFALAASGVVHVPFMAKHDAADPGDDVADDRPAPPPLPDDEEGLLAEIRRENRIERPDREGHGNPSAAIADAATGDMSGEPASGDSPTPDEATGENPPAGRVRDPIVDQLKATLDPTDPGQLSAFLMLTFTGKGTKLGPEDLELLFQGLAAQDDFGIRNLLFAHLERLGGAEVVQGILGFLGEEQNPQALSRGLQALGRMADDASVRGLVSFLGETGNNRLRDVAFQSLLATRSGAATDDLISLLASTADPNVSRYALAGLSQLGGDRGAAMVLSWAASSDPSERALGLKSLRDMSNPAALPALTDALSRGGDASLRTEILRALARTRQPAAVTPALRVATSDPSPTVRMEAIRTVTALARSEAIPALTSIAAQDQNPGVRKAAARAVQTIERREAARAARGR